MPGTVPGTMDITVRKYSQSPSFVEFPGKWGGGEIYKHTHTHTPVMNTKIERYPSYVNL